MDDVLKTSRDRVSGSIAEIVLSFASSTQTAPAPTATLEGAAPSGTVARSLPVCGSSASAPAPPRGGLTATVSNQHEGG